MVKHFQRYQALKRISWLVAVVLSLSTLLTADITAFFEVHDARPTKTEWVLTNDEGSFTANTPIVKFARSFIVSHVPVVPVSLVKKIKWYHNKRSAVLQGALSDRLKNVELTFPFFSVMTFSRGSDEDFPPRRMG